MEKLLSRVTKTDGCWLWTGYTRKDGYGQTKLDGKTIRVHRVFYIKLVGEIPAGLHLDHLCRVRNCVNPAHLEAVTGSENILRGVSFSAVNFSKEYCVNGHKFDEENTYIRPNGARDCRKCICARVMKYKRRKTA